MAQTDPKIRLFVEAPLVEGASVALGREQAHYLSRVMRRGEGKRVLLFNGRDGEWLGEVAEAGKRAGLVQVLAPVRAQDGPPDLWLLFAPLKNARSDFVAEKACEMGCRRLVPVFTCRTITERVNRDRLAAHAVEAAEQCGLLSVPEVAEPAPLHRVLAAWPEGRRLLFCDESGTAPPAAEVLRRAAAEAAAAGAGPGSGPWAVLVGPEGGFAEEEAARLREAPFARAVSLGPRVLRADTAAVAALALFQAILGDWR